MKLNCFVSCLPHNMISETFSSFIYLLYYYNILYNMLLLLLLVYILSYYNYTSSCNIQKPIQHACMTLPSEILSVDVSVHVQCMYVS